MFGYNFGSKGLNILPNIGFKAVNINTPSHSKNGTTVKEHDTTYLEGNLGLKISHEIVNENGMSFIPEISGSIGKDFRDKDKNDDVEIVIEGAPGSFKLEKSKERELVKRLGVGFTIKSKNVEYGMNIDSNFVGDYRGYYGSLKLKIHL